MSSNLTLSASQARGSRPIATFDLTGRCPLRCAHCYFYAAPVPGSDLDDASFLARLRAMRDAYGIRSAFWVGGEPLLRLDGATREGALARLRRVALDHPGTVLNPIGSLEFFRARLAVAEIPCVDRDRAIAFDVRLTPKQPCTFGTRADCTACGCPVMALHAARGDDQDASEVLLRALFTRREVLDG